MKLFVNGDSFDLPQGLTIEEMLHRLSVDSRKTAIGRNGVVVPKSQYEKIHLEEGDQIDLVHFVAGG